MSTAEDFQIVAFACAAASERTILSLDTAMKIIPACNNLFNPRPLKELIAMGYTRFQDRQGLMELDTTEWALCVPGKETWIDIATLENQLFWPIPTPADMGGI